MSIGVSVSGLVCLGLVVTLKSGITALEADKNINRLLFGVPGSGIRRDPEGRHLLQDADCVA